MGFDKGFDIVLPCFVFFHPLIYFNNKLFDQRESQINSKFKKQIERSNLNFRVKVGLVNLTRQQTITIKYQRSA